MTADWYLFWKQHNARPVVSEYQLDMAIMLYGMEMMTECLATAVIPAFTAMAGAMTALLRTARRAEK
jgi:hypothetical protein